MCIPHVSGNQEKAVKILKKAMLYETKPREDIEEALEKLKHGDTNIFVSPVSRRHFERGKLYFYRAWKLN